MKNGLLLVIALMTPAVWAGGEDLIYEGTWLTTNRKLDGTLTCVVTDLGSNQWRGHFSGVWQEVPFSYTVTFAGPPDKLHGTARIDGADYEWTGSLSMQRGGQFQGSFGGNRYIGSFEMHQRTRSTGQ
jgi:hypothetical protein